MMDRSQEDVRSRQGKDELGVILRRILQLDWLAASASLFIQNSDGSNRSMLFQNIDHNIFGFWTCVSLPLACLLVIIDKS